MGGDRICSEKSFYTSCPIIIQVLSVCILAGIIILALFRSDINNYFTEERHHITLTCTFERITKSVSTSCTYKLSCCESCQRVVSSSYQCIGISVTIENKNKKAVRLMAQLIKFYKFYYLLYLNKRWLNSQ